MCLVKKFLEKSLFGGLTYSSRDDKINHNGFLDVRLSNHEICNYLGA